MINRVLLNARANDRFTCTSANVIYCITCTLCKKIHIGETGRRLGDRFREHLRNVEKNDKDASKPVARYFNLPNHSSQHVTICGLSLHQGNTESRNNLEQKFIFQIGTLNPPVSYWVSYRIIPYHIIYHIVKFNFFSFFFFFYQRTLFIQLNSFLFFTLPCFYQ